MQTNADFIIIGAGSAGCALAERLSADGKHQILLLEAGPSDRRLFIKMPLGYGKTYKDRRINWAYNSEPDPGLNQRKDYWPRGKVLGGSSSINAMVYARGAPRDYDDWEVAGAKGWGWQDVLPAFKAIEGCASGDPAYRGTSGPLHISDVKDQLHPLSERLLEAGQQLQLPIVEDFNGESQRGLGNYQLTIKNGRRWSAADAFLRPALKRANLRLEKAALVTRLLFDGTRCIGVELLRHGKQQRLTANKAVILSGGSIASPQLLMASGIGDAANLNSLNINPVVNNPNVGRHLQDHLGFNFYFKSRIPSLNATLNNPLRRWRSGLQYLLTRRGPLALSINQAGGFLGEDANGHAAAQLYLQVITTINWKNDDERGFLGPDKFDAFALGFSTVRPTSRGNISLASSDVRDNPVIQPNSLATEIDKTNALEASRWMRRIAETPAMAEVIDKELEPGVSVQSDADMLAYFRANAGTVYHPCGTCRIAASPTDGVVDPNLKVYGTERLYVADASVFPNVISGNTNAPSIMVGYKGAEHILADTA